MPAAISKRREPTESVRAANLTSAARIASRERLPSSRSSNLPVSCAYPMANPKGSSSAGEPRGDKRDQPHEDERTRPWLGNARRDEGGAPIRELQPHQDLPAVAER